MLALSACTGTEQDACEAGRSSRGFGEPAQHGRAGPIPSKEQPGRSLPRRVGLRTREGCGDHPLPRQLPAQGASPLAPELPAPEANNVNDANPLCKVQNGPGLVCPHLWGMSVLQIQSSRKDLFLPEEPPAERGGRNLSLCHRTRREQQPTRQSPKHLAAAFVPVGPNAAPGPPPAPQQERTHSGEQQSNSIPSPTAGLAAIPGTSGMHEGTQQQHQQPQTSLSLLLLDTYTRF